jgi:RNA polymerase sigma-70 factor, ECF subfamily
MGVRMAMDASDLDVALDDEIGDDLLGLIFICCHPLLSTEARVALTPSRELLLERAAACAA